MKKREFANSLTEKIKRENRRIYATSVKAEVDREDTFTPVLHRRQISTKLDAEELLLGGRRIGKRENPDDDRSLTASAHSEFH